MKAKKVVTVPTAEFRVWCEGCCIRIAPHEERTAADGKFYHPRCFSKLPAAAGKTTGPALTVTGSVLP